MPSTLSNLIGRLPKTRRAMGMFEQVDVLVPGWDQLVSDPQFSAWAHTVDSDSGNRMIDRIQCLMDDPVYAAKDLAIILRLFAATQARRGLLNPAAESVRAPQAVLAGKYELIRQLGQGGNGEVSLVWSSETDTFYALKTIRGDLMSDSSAREEFRREAGLWIQLDAHPHVAKAHYFEEVHPRLFITMELVEGGSDGTGPSLADRIEAGRISDEQALAWFYQIATGLEHAYANGIRAHRDIKPGNILIGRSGLAQISDFGLAVSVQSHIEFGDAGGPACGTPFFMSPEQFESTFDCDERSDLYSLGVTLYQTASGGILPFVPRFTPSVRGDLQRFYSELRLQHETQAPPPLRSRLWPVIERCLMKHPRDRLGGMAAFRNALNGIAGGSLAHWSQPVSSPNAFWALRDQGNSCLRLGEYQRAVEYFDRFLAILPDSGVRQNRAICLQNLGQPEAALEEFERLVQHGSADAMVNMVGCLLKLNRVSQAIEWALRAVSDAPNESMAWLSLGNARFSASQWTDAADAYSRAHHLDLANPTPLYNLGLAALRGNMRGLANDSFEEFMRRALPDDDRREFVERVLAKGT